MPELPDVTIYVERINALIAGHALRKLSLKSPFVLRTVLPSPKQLEGAELRTASRVGKRIALHFGNDLIVAIHLMIAGRLRWRTTPSKKVVRNEIAIFMFDHGELSFTEASAKKRASIHILDTPQALAALNRGGIEVMQASREDFSSALRRENHTVKRALTDPTVLSGIGNAYSDEILHAARLSPVKLTQRLSDEEMRRLYDATQSTLTKWTEQLRAEVGEGFPDKVTAFREGMAVHGKYDEPCPVCGDPVQRIRFADNEANYCATCQNTGKLLADRALSRLMKSNWPKTLAELEELRRSKG